MPADATVHARATDTDGIDIADEDSFAVMR